MIRRIGDVDRLQRVEGDDRPLANIDNKKRPVASVMYWHKNNNFLEPLIVEYLGRSDETATDILLEKN